jgi:hypothetical protein
VPSGEINQNPLNSNQGDRHYITYNPEITLAMYRELASHLEQIDGLQVELLGQGDREFTYLGSQIAGIYLNHPASCKNQQVLVEKVLNHYGSWQ